MATLNIPESLCSIKKNSLMLRLVNNFSTIIVFGDVVIGAGLYLALMLVLVKYYDVVHYFVGWF
ncbi:MAG: hypothetical protein WCK65_06840, partial [Rhodospirillaceae bacterium]